jgi:CRP/FNR family cyclic AMP-dependent transcriptional regulator
LYARRGMDWPILAGAPAEDVAALLTVARRRGFRKGEVVFHAGDPGDALHLIHKGRFAVRAMTPRGEAGILTIFGPGEAFGEMALLAADHERSATVEALEPGETLSVVRGEFQRLQARHPGVMTAVAVILTHRVSRLSRRVLVAHFLDADARARWAVAELADLYCSDVGSPAVVALTQEQIAEFAGSSRATVNRVLGEEQERGVVRLERGRVTVLDAAALRRRAHI